MELQELLDLIPEANDKSEGYAESCICLYANDASEYAKLGEFLMAKAPYIINDILPLDDNCDFSWDKGHTTFGLILSDNRGILIFEYGLKNLQASENDCYYIRFFGFKSADIPISGPSALIKEIKDSLTKEWENTTIISGNLRTSYKKEVKKKQEKAEKEAKKKQKEAWVAQGLCEYCGGQIGFLKKCKTCGAKK